MEDIFNNIENVDKMVDALIHRMEAFSGIDKTLFTTGSIYLRDSVNCIKSSITPRVVSELDIAWAAGLFEGEGCFNCQEDTACRPRAAMSLTDHDVILRFCDIVKLGTLSDAFEPRNHRHKKFWQWWTTEEETYALYDLLKPYLGPRRREQAEIAFIKRENYIANRSAERECPGCEIKFSPETLRKAGKRKFCSSRCGANFRQNLRRRTQKEFNYGN